MLYLDMKQKDEAVRLYSLLSAETTSSMLRFTQYLTSSTDWPLLGSSHSIVLSSLRGIRDTLCAAASSNANDLVGLSVTGITERIISSVLSSEWDPWVYSFLVGGVNPVEHMLAKEYRGGRRARASSHISEETLKYIAAKSTVRLHRSPVCAETISLNECLFGMASDNSVSEDQAQDVFAAVAYVKAQSGMRTYDGSSDLYGLNRFLGRGAETFESLKALWTSSQEELAEQLVVNPQGSPMHIIAQRRLQGCL